MKRIVYTLLLWCLTIPFISAQKSVGEWSSYLAYYSTTRIAEGNNHVFAVADGSLYSYNKEDNSITHYSKQTGLSDSDISHIRFNPAVNTLLITYANGNMDLLGDFGIYNLSYLLDNSNITNKTINNIDLDKEFAYLSTDFGVIVLNMDKKEIKDTYKLNKAVYSVAIDGNYIYAATSQGLTYASLDSNLLDYNEWQPYSLSSSPLQFDTTTIRQICFFKGKLCFFVNQAGNKGIYYLQSEGNVASLLKSNDLTSMVMENDKLMAYTYSLLYIYSSLSPSDRNTINAGNVNGVSSLKDPNTFWIAAGTSGIKGIQKKNNSYEVILENTNDNANCPKRNFNYFMTTYEDQLLIAGGGRGSDRWNRSGTFMKYQDGVWHNFDENIINNAFRRFWDYTGIAIDPKDPEHYFISSYGEGIAELRNDEAVQLYDTKNSTLESIGKLDAQHYVRIGGITFDKNGNLWATNCEVPSILQVLKTDGSWQNFRFNELALAYKADKITITSDNRKWVNCDQGILVFNEKGTFDDTSDDESHLYENNAFNDSNGNIAVGGYYCITEDKTGQVWIGTSRGPIVCRNPRNSIDKISCERIVRSNDENGTPYYLLGEERVNAIVVDGGNRKWIGTQSSGVFLVSEDGMETIFNFTTTNSPLPSNQINTLAINPKNGEVFIGTEKGLVSYMSDATEGKEDYSDVYAYPNPVRPEHNDHVTIVGLMNDSNVKITDLKGNIIYQGKSAGGTFSWDCRNRKGSRVATGVYLVLSATPEAKESVVTKIMVVK